MKLQFLLRSGVNKETGEYLRAATERKLVEALPKLPFDQAWLVTVDRYQKRHSRAQECTYWMWLGEIAAFTGHDREDLHEYMKDQYLPKRTVTVQGNPVVVPMSSTKLSVSEYGDLMVHVQRLAAELGVVLTDPNPWEY